MEEETLLSPPGYRWESTHQLARESMQSYIDQGFKYVVVSGAKLSAARESNNRHDLASYQQLFSSSTLMMTIQASADRPGPTLTILKLPSRQ